MRRGFSAADRAKELLEGRVEDEMNFDGLSHRWFPGKLFSVDIL